MVMRASAVGLHAQNLGFVHCIPALLQAALCHLKDHGLAMVLGLMARAAPSTDAPAAPAAHGVTACAGEQGRVGWHLRVALLQRPCWLVHE